VIESPAVIAISAVLMVKQNIARPMRKTSGS
jgi:hypothetical protein